jgi:redox-sensitive bicupin YhaK (pirin superfamily)
MMDQMGEVEYAPGEPKGTPWHPHRGFETVTYIIDGVFEHQDSHGGGGTIITNGDTQWMTAGGGILHIETPPEWLVQSGGLFHGIQLWVNLPARRSGRAALPGHPLRRGRAADLADAGALVRVIAGTSAARRPGLDHTPMTMVHATVEPGAELDLPVGRPTSTRWSTCSTGSGTVGADGRPIRTGQLAVLGAGDYLTITADAEPGEPTPRARRDRPRRPADPRARRLGRPVRDEHQGRGAAGLRGLPEGPVRTAPSGAVAPTCGGWPSVACAPPSPSSAGGAPQPSASSTRTDILGPHASVAQLDRAPAF